MHRSTARRPYPTYELARPRLRYAAVAVTAALLASTACSADSDDEQSPYEQALAALPSSTTALQFRDVRAGEERLGIDDVSDASSEDEKLSYLKKSQRSSWVASELGPYLLQEKTPWQAPDVVWEVRAFAPRNGATVRRLDDDVDLDGAISELEDDGYNATERDDATLLTATFDDLKNHNVSAFMTMGAAMLVRPDQHLVVSATSEQDLEPFEDPDETLADVGTFDATDDAVDSDTEFVQALSGSQLCDPTHADEARLEALGRPRSATLTIGPDGDSMTSSATLEFADEDAASADTGPRTRLLAHGTSEVTTMPYSDLMTVTDTAVDGSTESIDVSFADGPSPLITLIAQRDMPLTACGGG